MVDKETDWGPDVGKAILPPYEQPKPFKILMPSFARQFGRFYHDIRKQLIQAYIECRDNNDLKQEDIKEKLLQETRDYHKVAKEQSTDGKYHDQYGYYSYIGLRIPAKPFTDMHEGEYNLDLRKIAYLADALGYDIEFKLVKREK